MLLSFLENVISAFCRVTADEPRTGGRWPRRFLSQAVSGWWDRRPYAAWSTTATASPPANAEARWADLTDQREVDRLVAEVSPTAIVHLAAVILPAAYRHPALGRRVNVDA